MWMWFLQVHMRRHSNNKPYQCRFCNYSARQSSNIHSHMRNKHPHKLDDDKKPSKKPDIKVRSPAKNPP